MNIVFNHAYTERKRLLKMGTKYFTNVETAKDAVQGYLCKLLELRAESHTNLQAYVVTGFYNYCHNMRRDSAKYVLEEKVTEQAYEQTFDKRDLGKIMDKVKLAPKQLRVIMAHLQDKKPCEIAKEQKTDYNTTKANLRHAVARFKECL